MGQCLPESKGFDSRVCRSRGEEENFPYRLETVILRGGRKMKIILQICDGELFYNFEAMLDKRNLPSGLPRQYQSLHELSKYLGIKKNHKYNTIAR